MANLDPGVTGRKSGAPKSATPPAPPPALPPLLVDVKEARRLLANMTKNRFWALARSGAIELVGTSRKRFVVVESLRKYVDGLPRSNTTAA